MVFLTGLACLSVDALWAQGLRPAAQKPRVIVLGVKGAEWDIIKPLREIESHDAHRDHVGTTPVIAKHVFMDGDDVPGIFVAMGPGIRRGVRITGLQMSVYDISPTILHIYGVPLPSQMKGRVLTEIFENTSQSGA